MARPTTSSVATATWATMNSLIAAARFRSGLVTATVQNLFIVPSLYLRYGKSKKGRQALGLIGS